MEVLMYTQRKKLSSSQLTRGEQTAGTVFFVLYLLVLPLAARMM